MSNRFWNNCHPRQAEYEIKWEKLVPLEGKALTLEGELLRAASRIHYDYYNNGFGNNWSGALNLLRRYLNIPLEVIRELIPYARGRIYPRDLYGLGSMDTMLEILVEMALDARIVDFPDMFDLQEPDLTRAEEDEYEGEGV